jgi:enoyl-CoA hydratase
MSATAAQTLVHERREDGIALLTLDNPPLNALDDALLAQLVGVLERIAGDEDVRVVVLTSAGRRAFASGLDTPDLADALSRDAPSPLQSPGALRCLHLLFTLPQPVIAALPASAMGAGFQLALTCDLVVADERASFGLPELRLGVAPAPQGIIGLVRRLGLPRATEMVLLGRPIAARRAHELGLIAEVTHEGRALERSLEIARSLAHVPADALRAAKAALHAGSPVPDIG